MSRTDFEEVCVCVYFIGTLNPASCTFSFAGSWYSQGLCIFGLEFRSLFCAGSASFLI